MSQWRCEKNSLESKEVWIGDKWIGPKPGRRFIFKFVEKNTRCQHPCQGVPNGSVKRVSNHHPLAFNWHPFEGPGVILFFFFSDTVQLISLFYILWYLLTKIFEVLWILCFFLSCATMIPSLKLTACTCIFLTWKTILSFWDGICSVAFLGFRECISGIFVGYHQDWSTSPP